MRKEEKTQAVAELHEKFSRARVAFLAECTGLEGSEVTELRPPIRGPRAQFKVFQTTIPLIVTF